MLVASQWLAHLAERFDKARPISSNRSVAPKRFVPNGRRQSAALEARGQRLGTSAWRKLQQVGRGRPGQSAAERKIPRRPSAKIADLQKQFSELNADLEKLPDQLETARRAIVAARRHDEQLVTKRVTLEPIEANAISAYLLREQASKPLDELVGWLRWVRKTVPAGPATHAKPSRGEDMMFAGMQRQTPSLLVRALELQGSARIANQPVELRGLLTDFAIPAVAPHRADAAAAHDDRLDARRVASQVDRTRGITRDALVDGLPRRAAAASSALGTSDQIEMTIEPSHATLSISVAVDGEELSGEIQLVQQNVRITPAAGGEFANVPIAELARRNARPHRFAGDPHLARRHARRIRPASCGRTSARPSPKRWNGAVQRAGGQHTRALLVDAGKRVDERLTERRAANDRAASALGRRASPTCEHSCKPSPRAKRRAIASRPNDSAAGCRPIRSSANVRQASSQADDSSADAAPFVRLKA